MRANIPVLQELVSLKCSQPLFIRNHLSLFTPLSYYNLRNVTDSVCPLTPARFMVYAKLGRDVETIVSYFNYYQFVHVRVREEPHWQGVSIQ